MRQHRNAKIQLAFSLSLAILRARRERMRLRTTNMKHTLTLTCRDIVGRRVSFAASSRLQFLCRILAHRQRQSYIKQRNLPPNFLLVVQETWS